MAELLRNSAAVCVWSSVSGRRLCLIVGVVAIGFVESRSDSTTRAAQRQLTSAELKLTDIRRRFSQR